MKLRSKTRTRLAVFLAAGATAVSGLVALPAAPAAAAADAELTLNYRCVYPLVGTKDLSVKVTVSGIPDTAQVGQELPRFGVTAISTVSGDTTTGLFAIDAKTLEGSALAEVRMFHPADPRQIIDLNTPVALTKRGVPDSGPFDIEAKGQTPDVGLKTDYPGWIRASVGNLTLKVTPRNLAGAATQLGEFDVPCYQKPGQKNQIASVYVKQGNEDPPGPAPQENWVRPEAKEPKANDHTSLPGTVDVVFGCKFPIIPRQQLKVHASLPYPEAIKANTWLPEMKITSDAEVNEYTVNAMKTVIDPPAETLEGYAIATAPMTGPDVPGTDPLLAKVRLPVPKTTVPTSGSLPLPGLTGTAPPLVFTKPGTGSMGVNKLELYIILRDVNGDPHPELNVGGAPFKVTCDLNTPAPPNQNITIHNFTVSGEADTKAPPAPAKPTVSDVTANSAKVAWNPVEDEAGGSGLKGYYVYLDDAKGALIPAGTTNLDLTALASGHHKVEVSAIDIAGNESAKSPPQEFDTIGPLAAPELAEPSDADVTHNSVKLNWNDVAGATKYDVYQGETVVKEDVVGSEFTVPGLSAKTAYSFRVKAQDDTRTSEFSNTRDVTTDDEPVVPLPAPELAAPSDADVTHDGVKLNWSDVAGATKYDVYQGDTVVKEDVGTSEVVVDKLTPETAYSFRVKAQDDTRTSDFSNKRDVTTDKAPVVALPAPVLDVPTDVTKTSVKLNWNDVAGATKYDVYQGDTVVKEDVGTSEVVVDKLTPGTKYTFRVRAQDATRTSEYSNPQDATTLPDDPGGDFLFKLTGTSHIKAPNGDVKLDGGIKGKIGADGKFAGDLTLNNTSGSFKLLGFLPATADIAFAQAGQTTGTLAGKNLTSNSKVTVKLPKVKVFGMEIGGGPTCQTTSPADITLKSDNFTRTAGGTLTGNYVLPAVKGCGPLTPLISALMAGPGNTVTATLKP